MFLEDLNGISMMSSPGKHTPRATLTTDMSGRRRCGAFTSTEQRLQCEWQGTWEDAHITEMELLPIVFVFALWGKQ